MQPTIWSRIMRGYGPLAVLVMLLVLVAIFVPSKPQPKVSAATATNSSDNGSGGSGGDLGVLTGSSGASGDSGTSGPGGVGGAGGAGTGQGSTPAAAKTTGGPQVPGDPYSPPGLSFSGNNGGSTSAGVDSTTIHVSYRMLDEQGFQETLAQIAGGTLLDGPNDIKRTIQALQDYFNKHFQFYGRKIEVDFYNGVGSNTTELLGGGVAQAQADATTVAKQVKAFADISATSEPYADALSRLGVVGLGDPYMSQNWHVQHAPYIWSIAVDGTKVADEAATYYVKRLAGGTANYAGGDLKGKPRKLGTFAPENSWYQESVQHARQLIQQSGKDAGINYAYQLDLSTMTNQAASLVPKMKNDGITTILCGCDPIMMVFMTAAMARANYFPEIVISGTALTDFDVVGQLWAQSAAAHAFGISPLEAPAQSTQTIGYKAYKSVRGDEPAYTVDLIYQQMYMLAIGIQEAGPNLTPQSFEQGMFRYPPKLGPAGLWGFGPTDFTAADDFREICWNPNATSTYNSKKGAYIDPHPGQRYTFQSLPSGPPACPVPAG